MKSMTAHAPRSHYSQDETPIGWILKHWVIIAFLVTFSSTGGVILFQTNKIEKLEEKVQSLSEVVARIDERTAHLVSSTNKIDSKLDTLILRSK